MLRRAAHVAGIATAITNRGRQVTTLDRSKLSAAIGSLPSGTMKEIDAALRAALDLSA